MTPRTRNSRRDADTRRRRALRVSALAAPSREREAGLASLRWILEGSRPAADRDRALELLAASLADALDRP